MFHTAGKRGIDLMRSLLGRLSNKSRPSNGSGEAYTLSAAADVQASAHDDGLALLHISTGRIFLCNRTGSRIWQGIVSGLSAAAIAEEISQDCGVAWDVVHRHTFSFFQELEQRGLAVRKAGQSS